MASIFKPLTPDDRTITRSLIHENVPFTGSIISGTYSDENIRTYSHGQWESVYDYPYLSSSANHILDISVGYSPNSSLSASTNPDNAKKINMYNQMAQMLQGYDITGSVLEFDQDGDIAAGGTKLQECIFIAWSRLAYKDEIKKESVSFSLYTGGSATGTLSASTAIADTGATTDFRVNSPAGEYGILTASTGELSGASVGLVFYQAGVCVLTASLFAATGSQANATQDFGPPASAGSDIDAILTGSTIENAADGLRARINNLTINNTTEINSTIYFIRINHNDFNYSANPTYLSGSKIRVKNTTTDEPVAYITTVGLYSADNELLAVGKLSEPVKKTPSNETTLRCRLDY